MKSVDLLFTVKLPGRIHGYDASIKLLSKKAKKSNSNNLNMSIERKTPRFTNKDPQNIQFDNDGPLRALSKSPTFEKKSKNLNSDASYKAKKNSFINFEETHSLKCNLKKVRKFNINHSMDSS